jgi:hypothetical protein
MENIIDKAKRSYSYHGFAGPCEIYEHAGELEKTEMDLYRQKFKTYSGLNNARRFAQAITQDQDSSNY